MSDRGNERRHDHPLPPLGLHEFIMKISVNRMTGIDEPTDHIHQNMEMVEMATVQPQPPVVLPRMPVRVKKPSKEAR